MSVCLFVHLFIYLFVCFSVPVLHVKRRRKRSASFSLLIVLAILSNAIEMWNKASVVSHVSVVSMTNENYRSQLCECCFEYILLCCPTERGIVLLMQMVGPVDY